MKKLLLSLALVVLPLLSQAQLRFAFFSYDEALRSMPEYAIAQKQLAKLKAQYDAETQRVEDEFNKKYEDFLEVQRELAPTILQKRQTELQELMSRNVAFKEEARRLLRQAERDTFAPLKARLEAVVSQIGRQKGYAFVLNTDNEACPYIDAQQGDDINRTVQAALAAAQ